MINRNNSSSIQSNLMFFLVGGSIGATVALLFAPKPGKELRQDVSEAAKYGMETANSTVTQFKETAGDYYHKAQDKASDLYQVAFKTVSDGTEAARKFANKTLDRVQDEAEALAEESSNTSSISDYETKGPFENKGPRANVL